MNTIYPLLFLIIIITIPVSPQTVDSIKQYDLEDIAVEAKKVLESKIVTTISTRSIERSDALTLSELASIIPSVKLQTNSRGETLFFIRGAEERQISIYHDEIPLNTPWDNRIDLSLIPAESIGEINIVKGVPSVTYGANAVAGLINISSLTGIDLTRRAKISIQKGIKDDSRISAYYNNSLGDVSFLLSSSYRNTGSFPLPGSLVNTALYPGERRENSYNRSFNILGRGSYEFNDNIINIAASYSDAEKGVPSESVFPNPRYWRYPEWKRFHLQTDGRFTFTGDLPSNLRYAFGITNMNTQIDQYTSPLFNTISDIEKGTDLTYNGRLLFTTFATSFSVVKAAINITSSTHKEVIQSEGFTEKNYRQDLYSSGLEYEYYFNKFTAIAGVGYDISATPLTGDKPAAPSLSDFTATAGVVYFLSPQYSLHFSTGRKTRFPTLRESFSGALGRFLPNPGLLAEKVFSTELALSSVTKAMRTDISLFASYLSDGIVRVTLPGRMFQRVNQNSIRSLGLEFSSVYSFRNNFNIYFSFTHINSAAKNDEGRYADTLEYKPRFISTLNLNYQSPIGLGAAAELNYTGGEYGLIEGTSRFIRLPDALVINLRASYSYPVAGFVNGELFVRVNNLFDNEYYSQLGLPEPGRQIWFGLNLNF